MMELVEQLVSATGVSSAQAEGGAGLLLGLLKQQLASGDFSKVADAVPGVDGLIDAAPATGGGLGGLLGGVASALGGSELGNLATLAGGFDKLGLDAGMIGRFVPVLLSFLESKGGGELVSLASRVLKGH